MDEVSRRIMLEAIQYWQNDKSIHPLTCINNGKHKLIGSWGLMDGKMFLFCPFCGSTQVDFPQDLILNHYLDRSKAITGRVKENVCLPKPNKIQHKFVQSKHYPKGEGCAVEIEPWEDNIACRRPKSEHIE